MNLKNINVVTDGCHLDLAKEWSEKSCKMVFEYAIEQKHGIALTSKSTTDFSNLLIVLKNAGSFSCAFGYVDVIIPTDVTKLEINNFFTLMTELHEVSLSLYHTSWVIINAFGFVKLLWKLL